MLNTSMQKKSGHALVYRMHAAEHKCLTIAMLLFSQCLYAEIKEIAITIDDLPFVGTTHNTPGNLQREHDRFLNIVQALLDHNVPATGFVIAGSIEKDQWALLEEFKNKGFILGNHTYSHPSLNTMSAEKYISDIERADKILAPLLEQKKYFRYPYLAESAGAKKEAVHRYLAENNYVIAPVTIDSKDYLFNAQLLAIHWRQRDKNLTHIKKRYLSYIWNQTLRAEARAKNRNGEPARQILLIHANLLNSHFLGDVIDLYQSNGYTVVSLDEAIKSPAPALNAPVASEKPAAAEFSEGVSILFDRKE